MNTVKLIGLALIFVPGSGALLVIALRELVRAVRKSRDESDDADRALRIQREYMVPSEAVEPSKGRRTPQRVLPEITSNHRGFREEIPR